MLLIIGRAAAALAASALFALAPSSASSAPVKITATGTILGSIPGGISTPELSPGATLSGEWIVNDEIMPFYSASGPADANFDFYGAPYGGTLTAQTGATLDLFNPYLRFDNNFVISGHDFAPDGTYDLLELGAGFEITDEFGEVAVDAFLAILGPDDWFETEFMSGPAFPEELPLDAIAFLVLVEEIDDGLEVGRTEFYASVDIEDIEASPVPVPAAGWLAMAAFGGLFGMRRFRRA